MAGYPCLATTMSLTRSPIELPQASTVMPNSVGLMWNARPMLYANRSTFWTVRIQGGCCHEQGSLRTLSKLTSSSATRKIHTIDMMKAHTTKICLAPRFDIISAMCGSLELSLSHTYAIVSREREVLGRQEDHHRHDHARPFDQQPQRQPAIKPRVLKYYSSASIQSNSIQ